MAHPHPSFGQSRDPWSWSESQQRHHLRRCWSADCDLDPMILRARELRHRGALPQAACLEQELLPLI